MNKSKVTINKHAECALFSMGNETLKQVEEYNYLGRMVRADPNDQKEIRRRIGTGWCASSRTHK